MGDGTGAEDAVVHMTDEEPEEGLVTIKGPRITMWTMKDMLENGGNPVLHFERWSRLSHVADGDRSLFEMEVICKGPRWR